jgi:hypothetical protein
MTVPKPFHDFKPGEPALWKAVYQNIEYLGEIIITDTWQPEMGKEIARGDLHFRIVMLTKHQQVPMEGIADRRIALCIPAKAVREERESYWVRGETERLWQEQASLYAAGQVLTRDRLPIEAEEVFSAPDNEAWFHKIASTLLSRAYPHLPMDTFALKKTLSPEDVPRLFDGFFGKGDNREARRALRNFAVALGLAKRENSYRFDPENCPLFSILAQRLEEQGGSVSVAELYRELSFSYGLPQPLIALYLLCFVYHQRPEIELRLKPEPAILLRSGESIPETRLTAGLITQIWWSSGLENAFDRLCYRGQPSWSEFLPYARLACPEIKLVAKPKEVEEQETLLIRGLGELKTALERIEDSLALLSAKLGKPAQGMLGTLKRLSGIAQSKDYLHFCALVEEAYATPEALGEDISLCWRLAPLKDMSGDILAVKSYLDHVELGEGQRELDMDRVSILEQLNLDNLLPNFHLWASVKALFDWFRSRYQTLYLAHHRHYHEELAAFRLILEDTEPEIVALSRLNSIAELGSPVSRELIDRYQQMLAEITPCPVADQGEVSVGEQPTCPYCGLVLTAEPPTKEVEHFLRQLRQALKEQQRRLSSEAVHRILAQSEERRIDQFIKVVQTSELTSLVNLLDDGLVEFLRQLLGEAHVEIQWRPTLSQFAEKFPSLEEGDIDAAAAQFAEVLRKAFVKAKREHPGKQVRLSFEE